MNAWLLAVVALLPPLAGLLYVACRASTGGRFVAFQVAAALGVWMLVLMSFAFDQPNEIDLPLTAALLALPGTLLFALFLERWV